MSTNKKIVSAALTITTGVWMSGALFLVANAQDASSVQAQINALMAQIQQLQGQLSTTGGSSSYNFTRNLTVGSRGDDVKALQGFLGISNPTGYFGSVTKAALAKWQAANGVSPAAGYFGALTRAKASSMMGGAGTTTTTTGGGTNVTAPASGLAVSLASTNPAPGSLIAGSARASVIAVNLTAGVSGPVTVSDLKFHKVGVISDNNISGAYLVENGKVLYQYQSLSQGTIDFGGLALSVGAGQTRTILLQVDVATGGTAGNTVSFQMASNNDVTSADASGNAITETGSWPVNGNTFTLTTVSNPSVATIAIASSSIGTQITAGTQNNIVGAWTFTGSNSKTYLKGVKFSVIGSANKGDLRNVKLYVNGAQTGATLASVGADGSAYFDLSASPATINTGTNNVQVFADVMGSPSFNFQFEVLNAYDIYAIDSQYNTAVTAGSNTGTQVSIKQGQITVSQDSATPTGNIAKGQSNVALAKYDFYAAGEAIKVKWLDFSLAFTGFLNGSVDNAVKNVYLDDDAGGQLGSTISSLGTSVTCSSENASVTTGSSTYKNCFGNSTSPINYTIPANTTRVLTLKGDIQSGASFTTVTGNLLTSTSNNLQGLTSSASANSGSAGGSALTLATSQLTVAANTGFGVPTYAANSVNHKIGSFALTASSAEGVSISNLTVKTGGYGDEMQNLKVMIGNAQFGTTQANLSKSTGYSFSGTPFTVPSGSTVYVDVYADLLSNASNTLTTASRLDGCSGSGMISYTAVSCTGTNGGNVAIAGQPALQVSADSSNPASNQLVMGTTNNALAAFLFTETSNADSIKVTDLRVNDAVTATSTVLAAFQNLCLYNAATNLGCAGAAGTNGSSSVYSYAFHFNNPVIVPQAGSVVLTLKGDVSSFASSGATDNTAHSFKIDVATDNNGILNVASNIVTALGQTSNATATITTSSAIGNTMTVIRTKLSVSGTNAAVTARTQSAVDDIATVNFAADSNGALKLGSVTVTFSGNAPSSTQFWNLSVSGYGSASGTCATCYVTLFDTANGASYFPIAETTSSANNGVLSFDLNGFTISAGGSKSFNLRLNSAQSGVLANAGSNATTKSLSATIAAAGNVTWVDAVSGGSSISTIVTSTIPVSISSVSYTY